MTDGELSRRLTRREQWVPYAVVILAEIALTAGLRLLHPYLPLGEFPIAYVVPIMLAAYAFGAGPAVLALVVGYVLFDYYFLAPRGSLWPLAENPREWARFAAFFIGAGTVAFATVMMRASRDRAERYAEELGRARAEAERKAAQLESFIASMADGVLLLDADASLVLANDVARRILDLPDQSKFREWAASMAAFTLDGEQVPFELCAASLALRGETVKNASYRLVLPTGREAFISSSASPVVDTHGRVIGAVSVCRDISQQVEFERQRRGLYEREHNIADMLQQALIPAQIPREIGCCRIFARYQPALAEAQVGGDFYDAFDLGGDRMGILIGDVAGKGLQAAMRVAAARHTIRSYAFLDPSPARALTLANQALCRDTKDEVNLLTAFFAVLDSQTGQLTYSNGGHEAPVVCNPAEEAVELDVKGGALGFFEGFAYGEATRVLKPGDRLVLVTDGITEAGRGDKPNFDKVGVIKHLTRACPTAPEEVADGLLNAATEYAGGHLHDDAAILVVAFDRNVPPNPKTA